MKKSIIYLTVILILTGCSAKKVEETASNEVQNFTEITYDSDSMDNDSTTSEKMIAHDLDELSYEVPITHSQLENNFFSNEKDTEMYGLNAVTKLGNLSPQDTYETILNEFKDEYTILDQDIEVKEWISKDHVQCYTSSICIDFDSSKNMTMNFIMIPQKNLLISLASKHDKGDDPSGMKSLRESITFNIANQDFISNHSFDLPIDGSEMCLFGDGTYKFYKSKDNHDNMYYSGFYKVYYGEEAVKIASSIENNPVKKEDLEAVLLSSREGYPLDNYREYISSEHDDLMFQVCDDLFYTIVISPEIFVNDQNQEEMPVISETCYIGYYIPEIASGKFINISTANESFWINKGLNN